MGVHPTTDPLDTELERLFQKPVAVRADFTERVLAEARAESAIEEDMLDEQIEALLAASPIEPSAGFTERTLARARRAPASVIRFPFPLLARTAAGAAAAVILLLALGRPELDAPGRAEQVAATPTAATERTALEPDAALVTLLMLAEGLDEDARWLVHGSESTTLLALAH